MRTEEFDYQLPPELIAQHAVEPRDAARLLLHQIGSDHRADHLVRDLPALLQPGDLLVFNTTKVFPARLYATKASGGELEILLVHSLGGGLWRCMIRGKVRPGTLIQLGQHHLEVCACHDNGERDIRCIDDFDLLQYCDAHGHVPLPPYIKRADTADDRQRYQSVFAKESGSVAAPTASLHFTGALLQLLEQRGIERCQVQLHVGPGTFKPVQTDALEDYEIHREHCSCSAKAAAQIQTARNEGRRVIAVGTTVVRTLETAARQPGGFAAYSGWSNLFLYPPQQLQIVDGLLTNFHLPRSSLLMLVACLCPLDELRTLYQTAIEKRYRFYSYGDAMLLLPRSAGRAE